MVGTKRKMACDPKPLGEIKGKDYFIAGYMVDPVGLDILCKSLGPTINWVE